MLVHIFSCVHSIKAQVVQLRFIKLTVQYKDRTQGSTPDQCTHTDWLRTLLIVATFFCQKCTHFAQTNFGESEPLSQSFQRNILHFQQPCYETLIHAPAEGSCPKKKEERNRLIYIKGVDKMKIGPL